MIMRARGRRLEDTPTWNRREPKLRGRLIGRLAAFWLVAASLPWIASACEPAPGAACGQEGAGTCLTRNLLVECKGGTWRESACLGPNGCWSYGNEPYTCDTSLAEVGAPCLAETQYSCAADMGSRLLCKGGRWVAGARCVRGCRAGGKKCDGEVLREGGECGVEGDYHYEHQACATDRTALLVCEGGSWRIVERCRAGWACDPPRFGDPSACAPSWLPPK